MPNFYMCSIQMSSKYVWGIVLIASSLENKHVGLLTLIQSRVRERAQKGVNDVYLIKIIRLQRSGIDTIKYHT